MSNNLKAGYLLGLLIKSVAVPVRVDHLEGVDNPIVLAQPHNVHRSERGVLVDTPIAGAVAQLAFFDVRALVVGGVGRVREQLASRIVQADVHSARRPALCPQGGGFVGRRTVHL